MGTTEDGTVGWTGTAAEVGDDVGAAEVGGVSEDGTVTAGTGDVGGVEIRGAETGTEIGELGGVGGAEIGTEIVGLGDVGEAATGTEPGTTGDAGGEATVGVADTGGDFEEEVTVGGGAGVTDTCVVTDITGVVEEYLVVDDRVVSVPTSVPHNPAYHLRAFDAPGSPASITSRSATWLDTPQKHSVVTE